MSKEITLEELSKSVSKPTAKKEEKVEENDKSNFSMGSSDGGVVVSASDISSRLKQAKGIVEEDHSQDAPIVKNAFDDMVNTLNDRKRRIETEFMPIVEENAREMAIAKEMGEDVENVKMPDREESIEVAKPSEVKVNDIDSLNIDVDKDLEKETDVVEDNKPNKNEETTSYDSFTQSQEDDENDLDSLMNDLEDDIKDNSSEEDESVEELRERFKESLTAVKVSSKPININNFKIRREAVSSNAVLNNISRISDIKRADWVLYHTKRCMTFSECRGPELDALRKTISNSNAINGVIASIKFVYDHVVDANKPKFESWCKLIRTEDIESLYFGIYRACYADANLVARACTEKNGCKKTSLIDTNINDMVKFENDNIKKEFYNMMGKDTTTDSHDFESELIQISDDFVISFTKPTLYSTFIQYSTLKPNITEKYSDILNTMAYIDGFYTIDRNAQELIPISIKEYPNNLNKTVLTKLKVYTDILKTLNADQYNILTAKLNNIIQASKVTYVYPKTTCPECGSEIKEENIESVMNLLFTRAQLVQVKSL